MYIYIYKYIYIYTNIYIYIYTYKYIYIYTSIYSAYAAYHMISGGECKQLMNRIVNTNSLSPSCPGNPETQRRVLLNVCSRNDSDNHRDEPLI